MDVWEQNVQKNKEVTGESLSFVISPFCMDQFTLVSDRVNVSGFWKCFVLGITKSCTHLHSAHPPPPNSFQPSPSSIQLHPAHLSFHPVLSTLLEPKYCMYLDNFPKFRPENWKLYILTENSHITYLGGADSESGLRFLKFRPQNSFLGKFGPKKSKLYVLPENWHTWYLEYVDSYSNISFLNFKT